MSVGLAPLVLLVTALTPVELEYRGTQHLVREFERAGKPFPEGDPVLAAAARVVAREALEGDAASDVLSLSEAVSDAQGADPTPRALVIRGAPATETLRALLDRSDFARQPASHLGLGAAFKEDRAAIVVLLAERKAELEPFPRFVPNPGTAQTLCGRLKSGYSRADLYVSPPSGRVEKQEASMTDQRFCARLELPARGRYTVEVVARGPAGPDVVALFFVDVAARAEHGKRARVVEPTSVPEARRALVERINALREANGLGTLAPDELLDKVAQHYSEQMAKQGFFAHVGPEGQDIKARLRNAGYLYQLAGENLGMASGPLAAHFGIEHSPGHRKNLLEPEYTKVGIGVAFQRQGDREQVLVTELFASPNRDSRVWVDNLQTVDAGLRLRALDTAPPSANAQAAIYGAVDDRRRAAGAPPARHSEELEQVAQDHARRSQELDVALKDLSSEARVYARQRGLGGLSVSVARLERLERTPPELVGLADKGCERVGVGALKSEARAGKPETYWVAVVCAKPE